MAKCKWCGTSGLFFKVNGKGLCPNCDTFITNDLQIRSRQIEESKQLIVQSSNTDTITSRFEFLRKTFSDLQKYEEKGIETFKVKPSESLKSLSYQDKEKLILYGLNKELEILRNEIPTLKTEKGKIGRIQDFSERVSKYEKKLIDFSLMDGIKKSIHSLINEVLGDISNKYKSVEDVYERQNLEWCETEEREAIITGYGVAPAPYERLAVFYRKQKDYKKEVEILERFSKQSCGPGVMPGKLMERLEKARELFGKGKGK